MQLDAGKLCSFSALCLAPGFYWYLWSSCLLTHILTGGLSNIEGDGKVEAEVSLYKLLKEVLGMKLCEGARHAKGHVIWNQTAWVQYSFDAVLCLNVIVCKMCRLMLNSYNSC